MYDPKEDSYLLASCLRKYLEDKDKNIEILDVGSGSGIQAETCKALGFKDVLCIDIDEESINHIKNKGLKALKSNLFSNLKNKKFDLIVFNPPYLPEDKTGYDKEKDTTGGKKGYETILQFLIQSKKHLTKNGELLLLFSSLSKPKIIKNKANQLGYQMKLLSKRKLFFEELYVYLLKIKKEKEKK